MKNQHIIIYLGLILIQITHLSYAQPAQSEILSPMIFAQRHCSSDVNFNQDTTQVNGIYCQWVSSDEDSTMSLTTHFNDPNIDYVNGACTFTSASDNKYKLADIVGEKSAKISNVYINGNQSTFTLKFAGKDQADNANILFYLHTPYLNWVPFRLFDHYTGGEKINCNFTVIRKKVHTLYV